MVKSLKFEKGFTLIELLVVMAIIAILSGISIFALQGSREAARDARRKSDLEVIRSGLELYKADCNRYPPAPLPAGALSGNSAYGPACLNSNVYIQDVPEDPTTDASYRYCPSGTSSYNLYSHLEGSTTTVSGCGACNPSPCRYRVTSP